MSAPTHSPPPFSIIDNISGDAKSLLSCEQELVATIKLRGTRQKQNKQFLLRALNAHDDLLAALAALTEWGCTYTSPLDPNSPHALLIAAREAIAKAEGGAA